MIIRGTGSFLPTFKKYHTDEIKEICGSLESGNHFGIKSRFWAGKLDEEKCTIVESDLGDNPHREMARCAAEEAIEDAGIDKREISTIILATCTQPTEGARFSREAINLREELGLCENTHVLEHTGGSASAVYALTTAAKFLRGGDQHVLLVGVNWSSGYISRTYITASDEYKSCFYIFGDGAGAFLLSKEMGGATGHQVADVVHRTQQERRPQMENIPRDGQLLYKMNARSVLQSIGIGIPQIIERLQEKHESFSDPDMMIVHQGNAELPSKVAKRIGVDEEKVITDVEKHGNLAPAEPLVLFDRAIRDGRLSSGDRVIMASTGAGEQQAASFVVVQ